METQQKKVRMFIVDVECEWGSKSPYSGYMTEFGAVEYHTGATFHGVLHDVVVDPENSAKFTIIDHANGYDITKVMGDFRSWVDSFEAQRCIFISDNPAYDYMWIIDAFDRAGVENPFGHSARRIGDFYAGLENNWKKQSQWKDLKITPHDHNPVHDAMGNREALMSLIERTGKNV